MTVRLTVNAAYSEDADTMFERACSFADVIEATRKISTYDGLPAEAMVQGRTYTTDVTVFGVFKTRDYTIAIDWLCPASKVLITREFNEKIRSWRHLLTVKSTSSGSIWTDMVDIDAGALTPLVSRYARFMYMHRHKTRGALTRDATFDALTQAA